jgi:hypothetical protein
MFHVGAATGSLGDDLLFIEIGTVVEKGLLFHTKVHSQEEAIGFG